MKKKTWIILIISMTTLIIIALMIAPGIARKVAIKNSKEWVGRQIDIEKLKVNYFTGTVRVFNFKMFEADDVTEFVSFDTLLINLEPYQYYKSELVIEKLYIKGLKTNIIQNDSLFNYDDLVAYHDSGSETVPADTSASEPFQFQLSNFEIKDAEIRYEDQTIPKVLDIRDVNFFIPYIGWNQDEASEAGLKFNFKNEGFFSSSININPIDGDFDAHVEIYKLYLEPFTDYAKKYLSIDSLGGFLNTKLNLAGNINHPEKAKVSGRVNLKQFSSTDDNQQKFLAFETLDCVLKNIDPYNMRFEIDSLRIDQPYVYFDLYDSTNNYFEVLNYDLYAEDTLQKEEVTQTDDTIAPLYYAVNSLIINDGMIDFADNTTSETFRYNLSELEMTVDSITSDVEWVDTYSNMLLNRRGKLVAHFGFNPLNPMDLKLDYTITDFQLADLNIYSRDYMGFPIIYGDMYYKASTEIMNNQLKSENQLIIRNVELGEKGGGLYKLPLKFALFLLKDKDGVINLDVPVRGDLNDPKVSVGKIVWTTFKNLIVKVAAAPVKFLSGLIGVDPKDIEEIEFDYLDTTFTAKRQKQLDLLLELEQKKDGLDIELVYFNDVNLEKEQIAIAEAGKKFNAQAKKDYREDEKAFVNYLREVTKNDTLSILDASVAVADPIMIDSIADMFAKKRIDIINQYLMKIGDSTAIRTSIPNPEAPKNIGSKPVFEVKYSMK